MIEACSGVPGCGVPFDWSGAWGIACAWGLAMSVALAAIAWVISVPAHDVSIVDIAWSAMVVAPAATVASLLPSTGPRAWPVMALAAAWGLRLSSYIAARRRGEPEDRRYQAIRARNQPGFEWRSLYLVFGLQAVLAWIVALPLMAAVASPAPWRVLDVAGLALLAFGIVFEAIADFQLAGFRREVGKDRRGHDGHVGDPRVMDRGLWRYSRHPNYFGECLLWWGAWLVALSAGAWWSIASPLLMTVLLLKVSGVTLLERDIGERRPAYADYVRRTNAFIPGRPRA